MKILILTDKKYIDEIVHIHLQTFDGFFLTFLGKGFLKQLYLGFMEHENSNIIVALENDKVLGFIAYSEDMSSFYKYLVKRKLLYFGWYAFIAFVKKPTVLIRLLSAFKKSEEVQRPEKYIELASIGVMPTEKGKGIGSQMISYLKENIDLNKFKYISLETDAKNNEYVNKFYCQNGFILCRTYETKQGRKMNEYHLSE
ncbi:GNAT family N-acetyltransferase [Candidatus Stoquefichus massiliensis]|uniref:GNAT family N-acetyltransferase n=1 Tax=Candidatus Stoquefichus massiliensis TaxID=1470350 RepID=UPI000482F7AE|nr:GNAT family N-acetyltransferase [Candidatus Stoquefichus massiliensis]